MSLLHSFYCWGHMGVVLLSTVFFALCGIDNWKILTLLWVLIPIANILLFAKAPIYSLHEEGTAGLTLGQLFRKKLFWINGRSPESRTKAFIHAKQNADKMMQIMPFCRSDKERFVMIFIFFH